MRFFVLAIAVLCSASIVQVAAATTLSVCATCEYTKITPALAAAQTGDTVEVVGGHYKEETFAIRKSITFRGIDRPVLDGQNEREILQVFADYVTIEGFEFRDVGSSYLEDRAGIHMDRACGFVIRDNRLINTFFGIYLAYATDGQVLDNVIIGQAVEESSSGNAIHLWYCKRMTITGNFSKRHRDGIYFEFVDESIITGNTSEDNLRYGLHFMFSNDDVYRDNLFQRNGAGVAVMFSRRIEMYDNRFEHNWGKASYGLLLKEIYDATISGNSFIKNTKAIFAEGATRITFRENLFQQNGWAIHMSGGCIDNDFAGNDFTYNTFDLAVGASATSNTFNGNYWSAYAGYDLDRDGVGDVPYRPVKLFDYVVERTPEAVVLLRSLFVDIINFSEKVSPVLTPANLFDEQPLMKPKVLPEV